MKEENKNKIHPSQPDQNPEVDSVEGTRVSSSGSFRKRLLAKKWVFPATYLVAAAIILGLMWAFQGGNTPNQVDENQIGLEVDGGTEGTQLNPDSVAVTAGAETLSLPVEEQDGIEPILGYFDVNNTNEDNQAAMVEYGDTFTPHFGMDLARQDGEPFDVVAAMSGEVIRVDQAPVMGNLIEIKHPNGMSTIYSSIDEIQVAVGDQVKQGDMIARSGRNELEKDLGNHVHFEVWHNDKPVNPEEYL